MILELHAALGSAGASDAARRLAEGVAGSVEGDGEGAGASDAARRLAESEDVCREPSTFRAGASDAARRLAAVGSPCEAVWTWVQEPLMPQGV